jgi:RNA polymerase sigma-70 factor (ECF subfamily)
MEPALESVADAGLVRRIAAARAGHARDAEDELYRRLAPRVRLYGLRHLRDKQAADDLVQEALLITIEALRAGRVRDPHKLASFVLGTCRMVTLEIRRGAGRRHELLERFGRDLPVSTPPAPELDRERLADCLGQLPERERSVLVMTFYDERGGDETARFLGVSAANLRVVRHRALGRVRRCMQDRGGNE